MQVIVSMNNQGEVFVATPRGHIVTACFFKAEDETADELRQMGYQPLVEMYPPTQLRVGTGIDPEDLAELFVDP